MMKNEELLKSIRIQISNIADDLDHMRSKLEDLVDSTRYLVERLDGVTSDIDEMILDDDCDEDDCDNCRILSDEELGAIVKTSAQFIKDLLDQIGDHK